MALVTGVPGAREHRRALIIQGILGIGIGIVSFTWPDITALAPAWKLRKLQNGTVAPANSRLRARPAAT